MHDTYTLGMREVDSGSAQSMLDKVKEILDDLNASASTSNDQDTQTTSEIVMRIKSTMSDRANTEKSFNELLANYQAENNIVTSSEKLGRAVAKGKRVYVRNV